jgi:cobalt-zinc-cadmium efflux system protein
MAIRSTLVEMPGVRDVHDLHLWEITSDFPALSAHVLVDREADCHAARRALEGLVGERFAIEHVTLQDDHTSAAPRSPNVACSVGCCR